MAHISRQFDNDMDVLRERVLGMGALAITQLMRVQHVFDPRAIYSESEIADTENAINQEHIEIDALCARVIAKRQPIAVDLREILSSIHIINDIERIGDEAKKILHKMIMLHEQLESGDVPELQSMAALALDMLKRAMACIAREDTMAAVDVLRLDSRLDADFGAAMRRIERRIVDAPQRSGALLELAFIAKSLERCGDHSKNLAEEVIAIVRGEDVRHRTDPLQP